jgi:hypothetical protein
MRFMIGPGPFIQLVEAVADKIPSWKRSDAIIRLVACQGRVWVQGNENVGQTDAEVLEEGQCTLSGAQLLKGLRACSQEGSITVEADVQGLRMQGLPLIVGTYSSHAATPARLQVFLLSDPGAGSQAVNRCTGGFSLGRMAFSQDLVRSLNNGVDAD